MPNAPLEFRPWLEDQIEQITQITERFWSEMSRPERAAWAINYRSMVGALSLLNAESERDAEREVLLHERRGQLSSIERYVRGTMTDVYQKRRSPFLANQIDAGYRVPDRAKGVSRD